VGTGTKLSSVNAHWLAKHSADGCMVTRPYPLVPEVVLSGRVLQHVGWGPAALHRLQQANDAYQIMESAAVAAMQACATASRAEVLALPACYHEPLLLLLGACRQQRVHVDLAHILRQCIKRVG
jgi:hypothetical protein